MENTDVSGRERVRVRETDYQTSSEIRGKVRAHTHATALANGR